MGKWDKYVPKPSTRLQMVMQTINLLPWAVRTGNMTPKEAEEMEGKLWKEAEELTKKGA